MHPHTFTICPQHRDHQSDFLAVELGVCAYLASAKSGGTDQTAWMCRLVEAFAVFRPA